MTAPEFAIEVVDVVVLILPKKIHMRSAVQNVHE
jgi:hypothetical protein